MITVKLPDGSTAQFPDGTSPEVMRTAIQKRFPPAAAAPRAATTPPPGMPVPFGGQVAFADQAIESVPIAGPWLKEQAQNARSALSQGVEALPDWVPLIGGYKDPGKEALDHFSQAAVAANPVEGTAGQVFGTAAPFVVGGAIPGVSRVLGMSGGTLSQLGFGVPVGAAINATDTHMRGGSLEDTLKSGGIGAAAGLLPGVAGIAGKVFGKSVPRDVRNLGRAMKDDAINPATLNQQLQDLGEDAMVMDLGPNLQRQAGALASVPGQAQKTVRDAVAARTEGASQRVADDVTLTLGSGPELSQMTEQIIAGQKAASKPLYDAVRYKPVSVTGNLKFVLQTPMGKQALGKAKSHMANAGINQPTATVQFFDYMKQALDDIVSVAKRKGENKTAADAVSMANLIKKEVDAQVPGYAKARAAFAGPAQVLDAIEEGQKVFGKDISPGQLQSTLGAMAASEREAFLQASRASIEAQLGHAVNDALSLRNLFKKGWNEEKLRILLGNDIADDLMRRVNREAAFGQTANIVSGNSETAARQLAQGEVAPELRGVTRPDTTVFGSVLKAFDMAIKGIQGKIQPHTNARLAKALTSGQMDPRIMKQLAQAMKSKTRPPLPPSVIPMLPPDEKQMNEITIYGGNA